MWYESLPEGQAWSSLWWNVVRCRCGGIVPIGKSCPACGNSSSEIGIPQTQKMNEILAHSVTYAGGEGRYQDYIYLDMLQREWLRPIENEDKFMDVPEAYRPSARAIIAIVFWSYFETRIERLFRESIKVQSCLDIEKELKRNSSISSRLNRLYKKCFSTTYAEDLIELGYGNISILLEDVRRCRNSFAHGNPEAISDDLVEKIIFELKEEHDSWVSVFNNRIAIGINGNI